MNNPLLKHQEIHLTKLKILIIILLILGIFFRFANLDRLVYWHDEVLTSIVISGYQLQEILQEVFHGNLISPEDLQKYQHINSQRGLIDVIHSQAIDFPEHPPLYYVMLRLWGEYFGDSVPVIRSFSALISLLAFPCVYWLCLELFESSMTGWIAMALIAISPFHILYAKQAREYSLWTVFIFLCSATFLRAVRVKTKLSWGIYAVTLALGLYTYPFTALVAVGHGIYLIVIERFRLNKTVNSYLISSIAGLSAFIPWIIVFIKNSGRDSTEWTAKRIPLSSLAKAWMGNISRIFIDLDFDSNSSLLYVIPLTLTLLILVGYSIYFICRHPQKRVWLFILTMISVTLLPLMLPDLILGGRRSIVARYLIPTYLGIQLAVAYLLTTQISQVNSLKRKLWQGIMLVLFSWGIVSGIMISQAETWWHTKPSHYNPQVARIINKATHPLLIGNSDNYNMGNLLSLSYLLDPKVRLELVVDPNIPKIPQGFSDIFVMHPTQILRSHLEKDQNFQLESVHPQGQLWRLGSLKKGRVIK